MTLRGRLPIVTLLLLVANLVAAYAVLFDPVLVAEFGFRPDRPSIQGAFTSLFLHANVLHLLGNLVFLAAVGSAMELASGSGRLAVVFFVSGLVGVLAHYGVSLRTAAPLPLVGASGAVAGCAAYYSLRYTRLRVPVAPKLAASVAVVTVIWLALQLAGAAIRIGEPTAVAFWSHLGGFSAGLLLRYVFRAPEVGELKLGHAVLEQMNARGPEAARLAAEQHLATHPSDPRALWSLADAHAALGQPDEEAATLKKLLDLGNHAERLEAVRRLIRLGRISGLSPTRRMQLADALPDVARPLLISVIEGPAEEPERPEAILALAGRERETDPDAAAARLGTLLREYPLHPATERARARGWVA